MTLIRSRTTFNVVSRLIGIFDQVAVLAAEFQRVLADKLLAATGFDVDDEVSLRPTLRCLPDGRARSELTF